MLLFKPAFPFFGSGNNEEFFIEQVPSGWSIDTKIILSSFAAVGAMALIWKLISLKDQSRSEESRALQIIQPKDDKQELFHVMGSLGNMGNAFSLLLETKFNAFSATISEELNKSAKKNKKINTKNKELLKEIKNLVSTLQHQVTNIENRLQNIEHQALAHLHNK